VTRAPSFCLLQPQFIADYCHPYYIACLAGGQCVYLSQTQRRKKRLTEEYLKFILIVDSVEVVTEKALNPYIRDYVLSEAIPL